MLKFKKGNRMKIYITEKQKEEMSKILGLQYKKMPEWWKKDCEKK